MECGYIQSRTWGRFESGTFSLTFGSIISVSESLLHLNSDPEEPRLEHISSVNYCHRNPVNLFGFFEEIYLLNDTMEESDSGQQQKRCRCGFFG